MRFMHDPAGNGAGDSIGGRLIRTQNDGAAADRQPLSARGGSGTARHAHGDALSG